MNLKINNNLNRRFTKNNNFFNELSENEIEYTEINNQNVNFKTTQDKSPNLILLILIFLALLIGLLFYLS